MGGGGSDERRSGGGGGRCRDEGAGADTGELSSILKLGTAPSFRPTPTTRTRRCPAGRCRACLPRYILLLGFIRLFFHSLIPLPPPSPPSLSIPHRALIQQRQRKKDCGGSADVVVVGAKAARKKPTMPSSTLALPVEDAADFVDRMMQEGTKKAGGGSSRATARMLDENDARQFPSEAKTTDDETAVPMIAANNGKRTASNGKRRIAKGRGGATALALALAAEEEGRDDGDDDGGKRPSSGIRPAKSPLDSKQRGGPPPPPLVNYSPNSILAVRAAHAKTDDPTAAHRHHHHHHHRPRPLSTASIGYSPSLPPGTLSPNEKKRKHSRELERKRSRTASVQVSLISPPSPAHHVARDGGGGGGPERKKRRASFATAGGAAATQAKSTALAGVGRGSDGAAAVDKSRGTSSSSGCGGGGGEGVSDQTAVVSIQSLYRRESGKAGEFVDYMTTGPTAATTTATKSKSKSTNNNSGKKAGAETAASSSPESSADDGDLELKLDRE